VTDRTHVRMVLLAVLIMSLIVTLAARAFSVQVLEGGDAAAAAAGNRERELVLPAARGMILDQRGRPLAVNRVALDVAVSRRDLRRLDDDGRAVLTRLAALVDRDPDVLEARLQNCGTPGARPQPDCWNGAPGADPVVVRDVGIEVGGRVMSDPTSFPAVRIVEVPVRQYPGGTLAAHAVGHVGSVTAEELAADPGLAGITLRGRAGLELKYDEALRGRAGLEQVSVDSSGFRVAAGVRQPAETGLTLVTHIDSALQEVVEKQLQNAIERARARTDRVTGRPYEADGGAAVVLDVRTGAVLALASAPTFDANVWTGGISSADYRALTDRASGQPLLDRSVQSAWAPASTFKVVSTAAALGAGYSGTESLDCPSSYRVGGRSFRNFQSRAYGPITLARSIEVSCDTVFYRIAHDLWSRDGGPSPVADPDDAIASAAAGFGFGRRTGIDLPGEASGRLASRELKLAQWEQGRDEWCARAQEGYPEVADRARSRYLKRLAAENCLDGMSWRVGDALNAAIGQGDTSATVLQLAVAYAALANGGTLWTPQVGRALLSADGTVEREFTPVAAGTLDVPADDLAYLRRALRGVIEDGSARGAFVGFPVDDVPLAGKTGTGEVLGRQTTSWFASFAPADAPRYAVVMVVSQGGTGGGTAGPAVRAIHEELFGIEDGRADPARGVLVGGDVAPGLPVIGPDGVPVPPPGARGVR
jgi:penicillin-binding protein 2